MYIWIFAAESYNQYILYAVFFCNGHDRLFPIFIFVC